MGGNCQSPRARTADRRKSLSCADVAGPRRSRFVTERTSGTASRTPRLPRRNRTVLCCLALVLARAPELEERPTMAKGKAPMAADEGYCVKCKAKRKISNGQQVKMANGRPALKGVCPVCGTGMFKILPPNAAK